MEKVRIVLDLVGALSLVCALVSSLLPEGSRAKAVLARVGFMLGAAAKRAWEVRPEDVEKEPK